MTLFPKLVTGDVLASLVTAGYLDDEASERAKAASLQTNTGIERTLLELGLLKEDQLFRFLAAHMKVPFVEYPTVLPGMDTRLTQEFLERVEVVPNKITKDGVILATCNPHNSETLRSIGYHLNLKVVAAMATPTSVKAAFSSILAQPKESASETAAEHDVDRLRALANDGPVIKLVNDLITKAVGLHASDIHIEAMETGARARFRVDGQLHTDSLIADQDRAAIASRLKVMANLNISEKRRPQDGRAQMIVRGQRIDLRLSTLPTQFGESIVLRILDRERIALDWKSLGFQPKRIEELEKIIHQPHGLFLVSGPTGSGKTTTLYTALNRINSDDKKIVTVEDPIEFSLPGINQTQVEPKIEMTFARALRAILRQDPDVVMVGEIRDEETAEIAVRAALVGRLVLSTIHTNDAISAIDRLVDLGIPKYLVGSTLRGVLSQRLQRRDCEECRGSGCADCNNTGQKGRAVISELITVNSAISEAISADTSRKELQILVEENGFVPIGKDLFGAGHARDTKPAEMESALSEPHSSLENYKDN